MNEKNIFGLKIKWKQEEIIFLSVTLFFAFEFFAFRYFVTQDGPSHAYNADLIIQLLTSNTPVVHTYHEFNSIPVPNWTGHIILAILGYFTAAGQAEKIMLFGYLISLTYTFRYFVRALNPEANLLTLLIIPFGFSVFTYSGFYNFSLAYIFLFWVLGYFIRYHALRSVKVYFILSVLILFLYFTHLIVTALALLLIFIFLVVQIITNRKDDLKQRLNQFIGRGLFIFLSALPALCLTVYYSLAHGSAEKYSYLASAELLDKLIHFSPLVSGKYILVHVFIITFTLMILFAIYKSIRAKISLPILFTLSSSITLLILYFILPDNDYRGGYISERLLYSFFILLAVLICLTHTHIKITLLLTSCLLILFKFQLIRRSENQQILSNWTTQIIHAGQLIPNHSTVLPINRSSHWQTTHLSSYISHNRDVVMLDNYETGHVYFPLCWKSENENNFTNASHPEVVCKDILSKLEQIQRRPDYLFFYGVRDIALPDECNLMSENNYTTFYQKTAGDDFFEIYSLKK